MKFKEAAIEILKINNNEPLSAKEIFDRIVEKKLVETKGLTPERSLNTILLYSSNNSKTKFKYKKFHFEIVSENPLKFKLINFNNKMKENIMTESNKLFVSFDYKNENISFEENKQKSLIREVYMWLFNNANLTDFPSRDNNYGKFYTEKEKNIFINKNTYKECNFYKLKNNKYFFNGFSNKDAYNKLKNRLEKIGAINFESNLIIPVKKDIIQKPKETINNIEEKNKPYYICVLDDNETILKIYNENNKFSYEEEKINIFTYFMVDRYRNQVKIGKTNCIKTRYNTLKTSNPYIEVDIVFPFDIEKEMHIKFEKYHSELEWFFLSKDIKIFIKKEKGKREKAIESYKKYLDKIQTENELRKLITK